MKAIALAGNLRNGFQRTQVGRLAVVVGALAVVACSAGSKDNIATATGGSAGASSGGAGGGAAGSAGSNLSIGGNAGMSTVVAACSSNCQDFPAQPIIDSSAPSDAASYFAGKDSTSEGPCLVEPQDGTLFPANWLRPRFRFTPAGSENLFEIRLHSDVEVNDLVAYTKVATWTMPFDIWKGLAANARGGDVSVSIRAVDSNAGGAPTRTVATFSIAPVEAGGSMVYWGIDSAGVVSFLIGFSVGEEGTVDALRPEQVQEAPVLDINAQPKPADGTFGVGQVRCIGCHTSTPDGAAVAFTDGWPWNSVVSSIKKDSVGARPDSVTQAGARLIQQPFLGMATFSKTVWSAGKRLMITSYGNPTAVGWPNTVDNQSNLDRLAWFDLAAPGQLPESGPDLDTAVKPLLGTSFGFLARDGDPRAAVNPNWSHDGTTIAYTSAARTADGHAGPDMYNATDQVETDLYTVPFNDGKGGTAKPLSGASVAGVAEYYPAYSSDDAFIAFNRAASIAGRSYYRPDGEVYVIASSGGTPTRLVANDPPTCTGEHSPGVINSWPKWSPSVQTADGKSYYWLVFASARRYSGQFQSPRTAWSPPDTRSSQLYVAGIVVQDGKIVRNSPALYIWNQTTDTTNLTPAWDEFKIPPAIIK